MSAVLVVESVREGLHLLFDAQGQERKLSTISSAGAPDQALRQLSASDRASIHSIELRIQTEDITAARRRIGVVLIGVPMRATQRLSASGVVVSGDIDVNGDVVAPLDETELEEKTATLTRGAAIDAFVVSGMNSHCNPQHEQRTAAMLDAISGRPVLQARYWKAALNAVQRADAAASGLAVALSLRPLTSSSSHIISALGRSVPVRTAPLEPALLSALAECPRLINVARCVAPNTCDRLTLEARVARSSGGYTCYCTDARFEFHSITDAKAFAAAHLREQLDHQSQRLGLPAGEVELTSHDRYTQMRGRRGPVRVYLETIVTASRSHVARPSRP